MCSSTRWRGRKSECVTGPLPMNDFLQGTNDESRYQTLNSNTSNWRRVRRVRMVSDGWFSAKALDGWMNDRLIGWLRVKVSSMSQASTFPEAVMASAHPGAWSFMLSWLIDA